MRSTQNESGNIPEAWYRNFWLCVVIALPTSVVVAGVLTFWLALRSPDADVSAAGIHDAANDVVGRNSVAPPKH